MSLRPRIISTCAICHKEFERIRLKCGYLDNRKYCSRAHWLIGFRLKKGVDEIRTCEWCKSNYRRNELPCGKLETARRFRMRKYCSPKCAYAARSINPETRYCQYSKCKKEIPKRNRLGRKDSPASYNRRKYCLIDVNIVLFNVNQKLKQKFNLN